MLIAQRPAIVEEEISRSRSRFVLEPLEPGFGYTLGNALRRSLLSSIPGAAVTNIRIDGVLREFSTIRGVKEDLTEIILNIKQIVVSSERDEPVTAYLRKFGGGPVIAGDISTPAGVTVHNPDTVIATLSYDTRMEMELTFERGRGYVSAAQNSDSNADADDTTISIDSIYSPVLKASYAVESTRAGDRIDFDRLVLDVETKTSISPRDAVASAGKTLVELFGLAHALNIEAEGIEIGPPRVDAAAQHELSMPIEDLDLSVRSHNSLKRQGVHTVTELVTLSEPQLMGFRNFGQKSADEVKNKLRFLGLSLKDTAVSFEGAQFDEG